MPTIAAQFELLGWAPDESSLWGYLEDAGWAKIVKDDRGADVFTTEDGVQMDIVGPIVEYDNSDPENPVETKNTGGIHWNIRFYGPLADKMVEGRAQTEKKMVEGVETDVQKALFDRTKITDDIESKFRSSLEMAPKSKDGVKEGLEDATTGVRIFDPATINKRSRVWA